MKSGDLVMWVYHGERYPDRTGIIVSDYTMSRSKDGSILKNVYWFDNQWVRPIEQRFLEVISEET